MIETKLIVGRYIELNTPPPALAGPPVAGFQEVTAVVLHIEEFTPIVQAAAYLLPVTHGISLLQGEMLTGTLAHPWQLVALVGIAGFLLLTSWTLLWRELRPE